MSTPASEILSPETGGFSGKPHSHGAVPLPGESRGERPRSFESGDFAIPTGREEDWRFTPLDRLDPLLDGKPSDAHLSWSADLPAGVEQRVLDAGDPVRRSVPVPVDRIGALAHTQSGGAVVLSIPKEAQLDEPVRVRLHGEDGALVWGHLIIEVGAFARATVVLEHTGTARYGALVSVLVGDSADVELVSIQDWASDAVHVAHYGVRVGRDATYGSTQVSLGGNLVRIVETVEYTAPGGDAELRGLYFADSGQHLEHRLFVDHAVPNCRSNVVYKGALQGEEAHTVWIGDVLIRAGAEGTDTFELNRNLLLTDGSRADSVPNLEIETGEIVGAGHASATGRFDDEQLFYLQARGIPADEARRLVVRGFFADVINQIGVPDLQDRLMAKVEEELEGAVR